MQTLQHSYRGFSLLMTLNREWILYLATIIFALTTATWLGGI